MKINPRIHRGGNRKSIPVLPAKEEKVILPKVEVKEEKEEEIEDPDDGEGEG